MFSQIEKGLKADLDFSDKIYDRIQENLSTKEVKFDINKLPNNKLFSKGHEQIVIF